MCGIAGWLSTGEAVDRHAFEAMTDRLRHRGPDGRGTAYFREGRIALGHRRLAIQDLSEAGAQPMILVEPGAPALALTFNGEIYNHPELRRELEGSGANYSTSCDAETLLHAYRRWGPQCVERLRGIFAFAIWDEGEGKLFAARDHMGVKPFYFAQMPGGLAFASQVTAFMALPGFSRDPSPAGMADALHHGLTTGNQAIFEGVSRLAPGHCLIWEAGKRREWEYWRLPESARIDDFTVARDELAHELERSIDLQMLSDVPVHAFLSGGIDSSLVTALAMRRPQIFGSAHTLGFANPAFDETPFARIAASAAKAPHREHRLEANDAVRILDLCVETFDEPYGIDSALPMIAIAEAMAGEGVKLVLAGDGADECFAGYPHHEKLAEYYARHGRETGEGPARSIAGRLRGLFSNFAPDQVYKSHNGRLRAGDFASIAGPRLHENGAVPSRRERAVLPLDRHPVDAARRADMASYLPDEILVKVDRATMAFGIEARVPLLDHRLVELAFAIAPALHHRDGERKALLKAAAATWLPREVLTARKKGFSLPIADFFMTGPEDERRIFREIASGPLVSDGWLRGDRIERAAARAEYRAGAVLQLLLLDRWYRRWVLYGRAA